VSIPVSDPSTAEHATSAPSVSVIICAYTFERRDELACAVRSALEQTLPARELTVVVDNNPSYWPTPGSASTASKSSPTSRSRPLGCSQHRR